MVLHMQLHLQYFLQNPTSITSSRIVVTSSSLTNFKTLTYFNISRLPACILVYKAIHGLTSCYFNELCIPVSTVPNLSALRSAARGDLVVPRSGQGCDWATGHFVWLVKSPGTVYHWTLVPHPHYQLSRTCSRHIVSHVPTSLTVLQSTTSEHHTAPMK